MVIKVKMAVTRPSQTQLISRGILAKGKSAKRDGWLSAVFPLTVNHNTGSKPRQARFYGPR